MNYDAVHISGYLHKMTRDGRWQKRWFETNGNFLTYYKSKKMTKVREEEGGSVALDWLLWTSLDNIQLL